MVYPSASFCGSSDVTSTDGVGSACEGPAVEAVGEAGGWASPFCVGEGGLLRAVDGLGGDPPGGTAKELFSPLDGPKPLFTGAWSEGRGGWPLPLPILSEDRLSGDADL